MLGDSTSVQMKDYTDNVRTPFETAHDEATETFYENARKVQARIPGMLPLLEMPPFNGNRMKILLPCYSAIFLGLRIVGMSSEQPRPWLAHGVLVIRRIDKD